MINVDIEKKLNEKSTASDPDAAINETKLLLDGDYNKERTLLKQIGLGHHIEKAETKRGLAIEKKKMEDQYEGRVYSEQEIKELCLDYNLKFLKAKSYKGRIDMEIGVKIRHFFEKNTLNTAADNNKFFIMAPPKAFNLMDFPVPPVAIDPILFYRTENGSYTLVHKWGNEFTIFRLISGWIWRNPLNTLIFRSILFSGIIYSFFSFIGKYNILVDSIAGITIGTVLAFVSMLIYPLIKENTTLHDYYNETCWDSPYKRGRRS